MRGFLLAELVSRKGQRLDSYLGFANPFSSSSKAGPEWLTCSKGCSLGGSVEAADGCFEDWIGLGWLQNEVVVAGWCLKFR